MIDCRSRRYSGCSSTSRRSRGRANGSVRISPTCAAGPSVISTMRSARYSASSTSCVTMTTIFRSCSHARSSVSCRSSLVSESSIENGSSSNSSSGSSASARASETHCCMPSDISPAAGRRRRRRSSRSRYLRACARRSDAFSVVNFCRTASSTFCTRGEPRQQRGRLKDDGAVGAGLDGLAFP